MYMNNRLIKQNSGYIKDSFHKGKKEKRNYNFGGATIVQKAKKNAKS